MRRLTLKYREYFNPHSREGSDPHSDSSSSSISFDFNPHSREGSDGHLGGPSANRLSDFNPHSREGSDEIPEHIFKIKSLFQSTLPRRE